MMRQQRGSNPLRVASFCSASFASVQRAAADAFGKLLARASGEDV